MTNASSKGLCNLTNKVPSEVSSNDLPQDSSLKELDALFKEITNLTKGPAQLSEEELCNLTMNYKTKQETLLLKDLWFLTKGSAQLSKEELINLKEKYTFKEKRKENKSNKILSNNTNLSKLKFPLPEKTIKYKLKNKSVGKILLFPKKTKKIFITKQGKTRTWIMYSFTFFLTIIIVLLALRKL